MAGQELVQQNPRREDLEATNLLLETVLPLPTPSFDQGSTSTSNNNPRSAMDPATEIKSSATTTGRTPKTPAEAGTPKETYRSSPRLLWRPT
jgi:hypothetical protein